MNDNQLFLLNDVANLTQMKPYQIVYLLTSRQIPEPTLRIGGRRMFTPEDLRRIKDLIKKKGNTNVGTNVRI